MNTCALSRMNLGSTLAQKVSGDEACGYLSIEFQCIGVITLVQGNNGSDYDWGPGRYTRFDSDFISHNLFIN